MCVSEEAFQDEINDATQSACSESTVSADEQVDDFYGQETQEDGSESGMSEDMFATEATGTC